MYSRNALFCWNKRGHTQVLYMPSYIQSARSNPQQLTRAVRDARESFGACNLPLEAFFVREAAVQIVVSDGYTSIEDPGGW